MGQVPGKSYHYLFVGNGKVSQHFQHYFQQLGARFSVWSRKQGLSELKSLAQKSDVVLILIKDSEIENFIESHSFLKEKKLVHFSGSLNSLFAVGIHPLMTFHESLYDHLTYELIHFIGDASEFTFRELFPLFQNRYHRIAKEQKSFYHALCVMSGNFTQILWGKMFEELERLGIGKEAAVPYLFQVTENLIENSQSLTGPLARKDIKTIEANLTALKQDEFQPIYQAFWEMKQRNT